MVLCSVNVQCSQAGQGFGDGGSKQPRSPATKPGKRRKEVAGVKSGDNKVSCSLAVPCRPLVHHPSSPTHLQAVQRAVKLVEEQEGKGRRASGTRPVDPREASRGKVEYVKVRGCAVSVRHWLHLDAQNQARSIAAATCRGGPSRKRSTALGRLDTQACTRAWAHLPPCAYHLITDTPLLQLCRSRTGAAATPRSWGACRWMAIHRWWRLGATRISPSMRPWPAAWSCCRSRERWAWRR